jgi:hypothetical protein
MDEPTLASAFDRAERALDRIERASTVGQGNSQRETELRGKVRGVIADLDDMIRAAESR